MGEGRGGRRRRRCPEFASRRVFLLAAVMVCCVGSVAGICVVDNKKGWHVSCGVRDSYLFRLKDYGGVNANFDFSFGIGDESGFPFSIKNTKKGHSYHRRKDSTARSSTDEDTEGGGGGGGGGGGRGPWLRPHSNLHPPPPVYTVLERSSGPHSETPVSEEPNNDGSSAPSSGKQNVPSGVPNEGGAGGGGGGASSYVGPNSGLPAGVRPWLRPARRRPGARRSSSSSSSFFSRIMAWLPWPIGEASWFSRGGNGGVPRADKRKSHFKVIHHQNNNDLATNQHSFNTKQSFLPQQSFGPQPFHPQSFAAHPFAPQSFGSQPFGAAPFISPPFGAPPFSPFTPFPQPPQHQAQGSHPRTVGPQVADVLQVSPDTPADTDHVPSFAAKVFVVREAPNDYYPPGYTQTDSDQHQHATVEVPRTKFFCEEQRYLPGLYADTQLGCKVFHMCLPAAVGNTMTSFLCPNMTLFDQSILQCNWWYYVRCEDSHLNYDANLPLALSYRKVNAAQLPLTAIKDYNSLSLLDISARTGKVLEGQEGAVGRLGLADLSEGETEGFEEEGREEDKTVTDNQEQEDLVGDKTSFSRKLGNVQKVQSSTGVLNVHKLVQEEDQEKTEEIKAVTGLLSRRKKKRRRRRKRSFHPIFSVPSRSYASDLDSVLLSRLRRKRLLP